MNELLKSPLSFFFTLTTLLVLGQGANASSKCFTRHLKEAIAINEARAPLYAELSHGQSLPISQKLIQMEVDLIASARVADYIARHWQKQGIDLICGDFIEMSETPDFQSTHGDQTPLKNAYVFSLSTYSKQIRSALKQNDFESIKSFTQSHLLGLNSEPRAQCLLRHFLESIQRIAHQAPLYHHMAKEKGMFSPLWISKLMLKNHLVLLKDAEDLDTMARPLQQAGIPILCQDVPHIPLPASY